MYFQVMGLPKESEDTSEGTRFHPLYLPTAVRSASTLLELQDTGGAFRAVASSDYIYLFRQSRKGTLLVNRLRLSRQDAEEQEVVHGFSCPKQPLPVEEPTCELFMVNDLQEENFDVVLVPRCHGVGMTCHIFVLDAGQVRIYSLPLDNEGRFDLSDKTMIEGTVPPDATFTVAAEAENRFAFTGAPLATFYCPQERTENGNRTTGKSRRHGHVLLAARGRKAVDVADTLVTVEFAVAEDGTLANPGTKLIASGIGVTNYTITFDGRARATFDDIPVSDGFGLDFWLYSTSSERRDQNIVTHATCPDALYARLVEGTAIAVGFTGKNGQPRTGITPTGAVLPDTWHHVQLVCDPVRTSNPFRVFVDGDEVQITPSGSGDCPCAAWNQISDARNGFVGNLDELRIYNGAGFDPEHLVADWPFQVIEYTEDIDVSALPPRTPHVKYASNSGRVYGETLSRLSTPPARESDPSVRFATINYEPVLIHFP